MTIADVHKDFAAATLTITVEYSAAPERLWRLWADPRQLERWWGPPTHPATVTEHHLEAGGAVRYFMTAPDGERYHGGWRVRHVDGPHHLEFEDFFADDHGNENADLPMSTTTVSIVASGDDTTRMTIQTRYDSEAAMEKVLEMGMEEGITLALAQIDGLLVDQPV